MKAMNIYRIIGVVLLCNIAMVGFGQGRKTIANKGILSKTTQEYFLEEGMKDPVVESIKKYDAQGELIELKELSSKGDVKKWEKYVYDEEGQLVEEIFLNERGTVEKTEKNIYKDGLQIEKQYYNSRDKLYKKKEYIYEYRQ
jgi:hypothetical protein